MSVDRELSRLMCVRGLSIDEATVCPSTEHRDRLLRVRGQNIERGYCVSVDIALSRPLVIHGQSIVEATVCPWT